MNQLVGLILRCRRDNLERGILNGAKASHGDPVARQSEVILSRPVVEHGKVSVGHCGRLKGRAEPTRKGESYLKHPQCQGLTAMGSDARK